MKLQVAIDRVTLEDAYQSIQQLDGIVDIIEIGTSLIKEYGLFALSDFKSKVVHSELLFDLKAIDEGVYEFEKGYAANADSLTVMGSASIDTLKQTYNLAMSAKKMILIDLLETNNDKINQLKQFDEAIFNLHYSYDNKNQNFDAVKAVSEFHTNFPEIKNIAVAGGINLDQAEKLNKQGIVDRIIVGGSIMNSRNSIEAANKFTEVIK
ncbi:orotidine 5'-phosphate decarboxylase / HUMPS family protein [Latilactobacillus sakei]|uniref:orotidine 5'-phosphate decarboxylase / HUMPS family protein n=1 Tax=Latilactobacillus sakei TaxID=1599 RepID=UPI00388ABD35